MEEHLLARRRASSVTVRSWTMAAVLLLLAVAWIVVVATVAPEVGPWAQKWIRQDLVHSLFHVAVLPLVVGLLAATLTPALLARIDPRWRPWALASLVVFLCTMAAPIWSNMHAQPRAPFMMRDAGAAARAYDLDACLRAWLDNVDERPCKTLADSKLAEYAKKHPPSYAGNTGREGAEERIRYRREAAFEAYQSATDTSYIPGNTAERTAAHWLTLSLTYLGVSVAIVLFWLVCVAGIQDNLLRANDRPRVVLAVLLFLTYAPLAIYVDWYQHYYLLGHIGHNVGKALLLLFCTVALVVTIVFVGDPKKVLPWTAGIGTLGTGGVVLAFPEVAGVVATFLDHADTAAFFAILVIIGAASAVLVIMYVRASGTRGGIH